jgi:hypothetical protein
MPGRDPKKTRKEAPPEGGKAVTDTFTMPAADRDLIFEVQRRFMVEHQTHVTKSEIVRLGVRALQGMSSRQLLSLLQGLVKLQPGRPRKGPKD